jgi:hypothetical protein
MTRRGNAASLYDMLCFFLYWCRYWFAGSRRLIVHLIMSLTGKIIIRQPVAAGKKSTAINKTTQPLTLPDASFGCTMDRISAGAARRARAIPSVFVSHIIFLNRVWPTPAATGRKRILVSQIGGSA